MIHFKEISEYLEYINLPQNKLSDIYILDMKSDIVKEVKKSSDKITFDFYIIGLNYIEKGDIRYGRSEYNYSSGDLNMIAPGQIFEWNNVELKPEGYIFLFHKRLLEGSCIADSINNYNALSYPVNHPLQISKVEKDVLLSLMSNIYKEYENSDEIMSFDICVSYIKLLLNYSQRIYDKQYKGAVTVRKKLSATIKNYLADCVEAGILEREGIPNIDVIADRLKLMKTNLKRGIKEETGLSLQKFINHTVIDESKNLLLKPELTVSEVAFRMGFQYTQYYSKLFKQVEGITPKQFRNIR
ncbi:MAG: AraC family transcriptional regulator [Bacteroidales bacterium]|nr:AraC family transcriptional regulator [Bacteroidales bacterium]